jgi:hypothetical protein
MIGIIKQILGYLWQQWGNNNPQGVFENVLYYYFQWVMATFAIMIVVALILFIPMVGRLIGTIVKTFAPSVDVKNFTPGGALRLWLGWCVFFWISIPLYFFLNWIHERQAINKTIRENESKKKFADKVKAKKAKIEAKALAKEEKAKAKAEGKTAGASPGWTNNWNNQWVNTWKNNEKDGN